MLMNCRKHNEPKVIYGGQFRCKICWREQGRRYRERNAEKLRAYGRERARKIRAESLEETKAYARMWNKTPRGRLCAKRKEAKRRGLDFNLTVEDFIPPSHCPILGIPLFYPPESHCASNRRFDNEPQLDRIVPEKGYVKGNVAMISNRANRLKQDATVEEVRAILKYMTERGHHDNRTNQYRG